MTSAMIIPLLRSNMPSMVHAPHQKVRSARPITVDKACPKADLRSPPPGKGCHRSSCPSPNDIRPSAFVPTPQMTSHERQMIFGRTETSNSAILAAQKAGSALTERERNQRAGNERLPAVRASYLNAPNWRVRLVLGPPSQAVPVFDSYALASFYLRWRDRTIFMSIHTHEMIFSHSAT